jgi:signal transduction histidine kinase
VRSHLLPRTLVGRILGVSVLAAVLAGGALALLLASLISLRNSIDHEAHSKDTVAAALVFQSAVTDYESALHSYLLTTKRSFLTPLDQAQNALTPAHQDLASLVVNDREERARVDAVWSYVQSYIGDYARPLVKIAQIDPSVARGTVARNEDRYRSNQLQGAFGRVIALEQGRALIRRTSVEADTTRAIAAALAAALVAVLLIVALGVWVARHVRVRLDAATTAASEIATGDLSTRLDERGARELAELGRAFNTMARSLEQSRRLLLAQNAQLGESERQKSELITMVSHELRTPLTSLLGFTNLLLTRNFEEEDRRHYLEIVHRESRRLAAIVDTFLDLRSIEQGRLELRTQPLDLATLAREQASFLLGHSRDHSLALELPEDGAIVLGDPDRLAQVVGNLISNAVKYSPEGGTVELVVLEVDGKVRLEVTDHGLGIPPEDQPRVFTKFFRGQANDSGIPGTGLGLAVSREIVEAHHGRIDFVSARGRGSTFWVELPKYTAPAQPGPRRPEAEEPERPEPVVKRNGSPVRAG